MKLTKWNILGISIFLMGLLLLPAKSFATETEEVECGAHCDFYLDSIEVIDERNDFTRFLDTQDFINHSSLIRSLDDEDPAEEGEGFIHNMILIGERVWNFIVENEPVVTVETDYAHIVPEAAERWQDLEFWGRPHSALYRATYKNLFNVTVADIGFRVLYTPRGQYQGAGQYLANIVVVPEILDVAWGYTVDATARVHNILNRGSSTDPIASAQIHVGWTVKTILKRSETTGSLFVEGTGHITDLTTNGN